MVMTAGEARDGTRHNEEFIVEPRMEDEYFEDNLDDISNSNESNANNTNVIKITGISTSFEPKPKNILINKNLT